MNALFSLVFILLGTFQYPLQTDKMLATGHASSVHDALVDPTGHYLATCSSDRVAKVFVRAGGAPHATWGFLCEAQNNNGPVLKVGWAHPFFGAVLATASMDRTIHVYLVKQETSGARLLPLAVRQDFERDMIFDLSFAPPQLGLLLASACGDGILRVHDVHVAESCYKVAPSGEAELSPVLSTAWSQSLLDPLIACGCQNGLAYFYRHDAAAKGLVRVGCYGPDGVVPVELRAGSPVVSLAWAPPLGRPYQLLAIGSQSCIVVLRMFPLFVVGDARGIGGAFRCEAVTLVEAGAVKVSWNVTGTTLAAAGESHQSVRLFQQSFETDEFVWRRVTDT